MQGRSRVRFWLFLSAAFFLFSPIAWGFSLGIRPYAGSEMMTIPGTTLVDPADQTRKLSKDSLKVQRSFFFYGGELAVTPLEFGKTSVSVLFGFRTMKSSTEGSVNDSISLNYIPIGFSVEHAVSKLRASGFFTYDLGVGAKFSLQVKEPANALDLKMSKLSRLRFGGFSEFFISKSLSVFAMADYSMGSFNTESGRLSIFDQENNVNVDVEVLAAQNKISGLTFGAGIAFYVFPPASQVGEKTEVKPLGKKPTGKQPVKKVKPKSGTSTGGVQEVKP